MSRVANINKERPEEWGGHKERWWAVRTFLLLLVIHSFNTAWCLELGWMLQIERGQWSHPTYHEPAATWIHMFTAGAGPRWLAKHTWKGRNLQYQTPTTGGLILWMLTRAFRTAHLQLFTGHGQCPKTCPRARGQLCPKPSQAQLT